MAHTVILRFCLAISIISQFGTGTFHSGLEALDRSVADLQSLPWWKSEVGSLPIRMVAEPEGSEAMYSSLQSRGEFSGLDGAIPRNRDGIPIWNGEPALLDEFTEACLRYEQTIVMEKRYLCGPRIAHELRGPAKRVLIGRPADWLSYDGGVRKLIEALRAERGQPKVPEMSELLMKYFKGTRRQRGESMNDYVTRKAEAYTRAQQSMARYQKELNPNAPPNSGSGRSTSTRNYGSHNVSTSGDDDQWDDWYDAEEHDEAEESAADHSSSTGRDATSQSQSSDRWGSWWNYYGRWNGWQDDWSRRATHSAADTTEWSKSSLPEIIPDFIQGWYLFVDSGLDVMERNVLQAELRGDFSVKAVEEVLRKHWGDHDLKKRDQEKGKYQANVAEIYEGDEERALLGDWDPEHLESEGFSGEEIAAMAKEQEVMHEACAAIQEARRTLKDARARQHAVRTSRQFYPLRPRDSSTSASANFSGIKPMKCFRCGGPHKIAQCPEKPQGSTQPRSSMVTVQEEAPFVFLTENLDQQSLVVDGSSDPPKQGDEEVWLTTADVVRQGKAVIDGGATQSIGSVHALSQILELNEKKRGSDGLANLDMTDRPSFGFGNSSRDRCASTASLSVPMAGKESVLKVHALDCGEAPVLLSVHSLRKLGAIIDFEADLAVFRNISDRHIIRLERTTAGHQVFPLTDDAFEQSTEVAQQVPSLKAYL